MSRGRLARELGVVAGFEEPTASLEQYHTPPDLAAHIVHLADLQDDIAGKTVIDLGCGTGMLALGAALRGPQRVVGIELDDGPLATAAENEGRVAARAPVEWVRGDAARAPFHTAGATVLSNPPFGAQDGNEHADRPFLETAARIARVSYTVHNAGSREFVESFVKDADGEVTHAFAAELDLPRQFDHHTADLQSVPAEVYRVEW